MRADLGADLSHSVHAPAHRAPAALGRAGGEVVVEGAGDVLLHPGGRLGGVPGQTRQVGAEVVQVALRGLRPGRAQVAQVTQVTQVAGLVLGPVGEGAEELGGLLGEGADVLATPVAGAVRAAGGLLVAHRAASRRTPLAAVGCSCSTKRTRRPPASTRAPATRRRASPAGRVSSRR